MTDKRKKPQRTRLKDLPRYQPVTFGPPPVSIPSPPLGKFKSVEGQMVLDFSEDEEDGNDAGHA
jgi:hypothetical protein